MHIEKKHLTGRTRQRLYTDQSFKHCVQYASERTTKSRVAPSVCVSVIVCWLKYIFGCGSQRGTPPLGLFRLSTIIEDMLGAHICIYIQGERGEERGRARCAKINEIVVSASDVGKNYIYIYITCVNLHDNHMRECENFETGAQLTHSHISECAPFCCTRAHYIDSYTEKSRHAISIA